MISFWRFSIILHHVYFSPAARGEPVFRRVSRDVFGELIRFQAQREGGDFVLASFQQFYTMYNSPRLRGGNRFAVGFLETFRRFLFASKRNGRVEILFWRLSTNFIPCIFFSGCAGGTGLPAGL